METRTYDEINAPNLYGDEFNDIRREQELMSKELYESKFMIAERMKDGLADEIRKSLIESENNKRELLKKAKTKKDNFIIRTLKKLSSICQ